MSLDMQVKDYLIRSNDNGITVEKLVRDENGDTTTRVKPSGETGQSTRIIGFYPTLEHALKGIRKNYLFGKGANIKTIDDYRKEISIITKAFDEQLKLGE